MDLIPPQGAPSTDTPPAPGAQPPPGAPPDAPPGGAPPGVGGPQQAQPGPEAPGDEPNVSPEEQAQYDKVVTYALQHLYGDGAQQIIDRIRAQPNKPAQAIGHAAANLGAGIVEKAAESGEQIDDSVLLHAAGEIIDELLEVASSAGAIAEPTPQLAEEALYHAMTVYGNRTLESGQHTPQDQAELMAGLEQIGMAPQQSAQQPSQPPPPQQPQPPAAPAGVIPAGVPPNVQ